MPRSATLQHRPPPHFRISIPTSGYDDDKPHGMHAWANCIVRLSVLRRKLSQERHQFITTLLSPTSRVSLLTKVHSGGILLGPRCPIWVFDASYQSGQTFCHAARSALDAVRRHYPDALIRRLRSAVPRQARRYLTPTRVLFQITLGFGDVARLQLSWRYDSSSVGVVYNNYPSVFR